VDELRQDETDLILLEELFRVSECRRHVRSTSARGSAPGSTAACRRAGGTSSRRSPSSRGARSLRWLRTKRHPSSACTQSAAQRARCPEFNGCHTVTQRPPYSHIASNSAVHTSMAWFGALIGMK